MCVPKEQGVTDRKEKEELDKLQEKKQLEQLEAETWRHNKEIMDKVKAQVAAERSAVDKECASVSFLELSYMLMREIKNQQELDKQYTYDLCTGKIYEKRLEQFERSALKIQVSSVLLQHKLSFVAENVQLLCFERLCIAREQILEFVAHLQDCKKQFPIALAWALKAEKFRKHEQSYPI